MINGGAQHIHDAIQSMTIEQKVGQLFLLAYPGKDPHKIAPIVSRFGLGGCYISQDNAATFHEAQQITTALQQMALQSALSLPMILGVDQEGAWGVLVPESLTGPGNLALGAHAQSAVVAEMYRVMGEEMRAAGYNALYAPCADVNSNPHSPIIGTRSFGEDPHHVAALVAQAVRGARSSGIVTTLKHFPGHGATHADTHREIPRVDKNIDELLETDLLPFKAGIDAGVDMVMTAHICYPQIDPHNPATLSSEILHTVLRKRLGFEGIIVSDSMNMGAIRHHYDAAQSTVQALKAGVDLVMLAEEHYDHSREYLKKQIASLEAVSAAIKAGEIAMPEIDAKLRRIISLKLSISSRLNQKQPPSLSGDEKKRIEQRAAAGAVCLIRDSQRMWPPTLNDQTLCVNATPRSAYRNMVNVRGIGPNQETPAFDFLRDAIAHARRGVRFLEYAQAVDNRRLLREAALLLIITEDYPLPGEEMDKQTQQDFVRDCLQTYGKKCMVIGLRSPYELIDYPQDTTYLCAYSSRACAAVQTAHALLSGVTPRGVNRITLKERSGAR